MFRVRVVLFAMMATAGMSAAPVSAGDSGQSVELTFPVGSEERAEIMDAIRAGTGATSIFVVDHLQGARGDGGYVAFARVHPAQTEAKRPFTGWVLLYKGRRDWTMQYGIGSDGASSCYAIWRVHAMAADFVEEFFDGAQIFDHDFVSEVAESPSSDSDLACAGEIVKGLDAERSLDRGY